MSAKIMLWENESQQSRGSEERDKHKKSGQAVERQQCSEEGRGGGGGGVNISIWKTQKSTFNRYEYQEEKHNICELWELGRC